MALKPGLVFNVMASAYRHDVIDKSMSLAGDAIDRVMQDTGLKVGDLVNKMDEARNKTVMRIDRLLAWSGPMLKVAANDRLMAGVSRMLDFKVVKKTTVAVLRRAMMRAATGKTPSAAGSDPASAGLGA